ncbi:MAG: TetR/AcrR family transcriptional regulator [Pirellulaceae bacterium]
MTLTGKREKNSQERSAAILQRALEVFARDGFHGADVQVIANMAGVGKGTVYRHFGNKRQLFLATARWCMDQVGAHVEDTVGDAEQMARIAVEAGICELLVQIALACAAYYRDRPSAVEMMIMERAEFRDSVVPTHLLYRKENREGLEQIIATGFKSGKLTHPVQPQWSTVTPICCLAVSSTGV